MFLNHSSYIGINQACYVDKLIDDINPDGTINPSADSISVGAPFGDDVIKEWLEFLMNTYIIGYKLEDAAMLITQCDDYIDNFYNPDFNPTSAGLAFYNILFALVGDPSKLNWSNHMIQCEIYLL
jgi:hypothetical protein